jgi:tight adherence protein B
VTSLMITSIVFVALLALFLAIGMVLRDVKLADTIGAGPISIKRTLTVVDHDSPRSLVQQINFGFDLLIHESGTGLGSLAAFLLMIMSATLVGGIMLLVDDDAVPSLLATLFGLLLPLVTLAFMRRRRLRLIEDQVPEVLSLMSRAVHAGETMEQAVGLAGEETSAPLGPELRMCAKQISLGMSVSKAMESLGRRVRIADVSLLSSILAVHRQSGGNLASTLEHLSGVVRDRASHRRQLRSATAAGRLSAQFIGITGPLLFLFLYFFKRDHLAPLLELPLGNALLIGAAVLEMVGLLWLMQMLRRQNQ